MKFAILSADHFNELKTLHSAYKQAIQEEPSTEEETDRLFKAIQAGKIIFYGALEQGRLVGCCSVCPTFSTFNYKKSGVFEDFYILPEYRHRGIARQLVQFAIRESGVSTLTVGCADCDVKMYQALGFIVPLGNLLAYDG